MRTTVRLTPDDPKQLPAARHQHFSLFFNSGSIYPILNATNLSRQIYRAGSRKSDISPPGHLEFLAGHRSKVRIQ